MKDARVGRGGEGRKGELVVVVRNSFISTFDVASQQDPVSLEGNTSVSTHAKLITPEPF